MANTLDWKSAVQVIGTADGYETFSGTTAISGSVVDMDTDGPWVSGRYFVEIDFDPTVNDYVNVLIYAGRDDGTNMDDEASLSFQIRDDNDPQQESVMAPLAPFHVLRAVQTGGTDTHDIRCYFIPYDVAV